MKASWAVPVIASILILGALGFSQNVFATDGSFHEFKKLTASDAMIQDNFGRAGFNSGNLAVLGASFSDSFTGSAYIYEKDQGGTDNWGEVKKLLASDGAAGKRFGSGVSVSGDVIVIGAEGTFAAYVFERNQGGADNWGEVKKLVPSDGPILSFGFAVSIFGDTIVIGAAGDDVKGSNSGSVYIFERNQGGANNWGQVKKITASDGGFGDIFGSSGSLSGDTLAVGARGDNGGDGSVYILERNQGGTDNWGEVKKISSPGTFDTARFGIAVSISGNFLIVGANGVDDNCPPDNPSTPFRDERDCNSGAAFVFERNNGGANNWGQVKKLNAPVISVQAIYGFSAAISGDRILVSEIHNQAPGKVYMYSKDQGGTNNWGLEATLRPANNVLNLSYGYIVSISGDIILVSDRGDKHAGNDSGSAYIHLLVDTDGDGLIDALDNCPNDANPGQEDIDVDGIGDACDPENLINPSTTLTTSHTLVGKLIVPNGVTLIVPSGLSITLPLSEGLTVEAGGAVIVVFGGNIFLT